MDRLSLRVLSLGEQPLRALSLRVLIRGLAPAAALALIGAGAGQAGVVFQNCVQDADGGITCDTRPTGNTLMDDEAARFGLFDEASPGWNEFDPYQGYDDMFGGNET
ncbi:lactate dehydrogenase [Synechococcus sp. CCY9201]|uniref:lactate dehydrogenase n=1 Tax=unclassified Synechococcus TaxID=2626047 RepID=UPI001E37B3BA|nr:MULTISPECIES: lactate dehydrogenase [unclassified Synechococcus]MEA5422600.1 lactate dehydrogenase [Synechococcus sp. CCY9202]MEA5474835.1 lactate dehydrogenase [Synechococcus sp. CCY9201]CAK6698837.1 hypothetical protein IFHNHDMJ_02514 [Synechococcus sp. CBW1107]